VSAVGLAPMSLLWDLGPHASYICASYAVVGVVLGGLVAWLIADGRHQQRLLDELESRGVRRRSGSGGRQG
jgi:heme exporter protein D